MLPPLAGGNGVEIYHGSFALYKQWMEESVHTAVQSDGGLFYANDDELKEWIVSNVKDEQMKKLEK